MARHAALTAHEPGPDPWDWAVAAYLVCAVTAVLLVVAGSRLAHWFLPLVMTCGVLIGVDVSAMLRGRLDVFNPQALLALVGFHFFFLAPMLHVVLDYWQPDMAEPDDWRTPLGVMAALNVVGLLLYRRVIAAPDPGDRQRSVDVDPRRFVRAGCLVATVGIGAFAAQIHQLGGPAGYLAAVSRGQGYATQAMQDMAWLVLLGDSFPLVLLGVVLVAWRARLVDRRWITIALLVAFAALQFGVGGLRGSRSSTVLPLVIGLMMVHLVIRRLSRVALAVSVVLLFVFMYVYGFYKADGVEGLRTAQQSGEVAPQSVRTDRDVPLTLLGDLGRADVQAAVLDHKLHGDGELALGRTYLGALALLVPRGLLAERPETKIYYGTETLRGVGSYSEDDWSSKVYGAAGEAMLNFGPFGVILSFGLLAVAIRFSRRLHRRALTGTALASKLIAPAIGLTSVLLLTSDSDNIVILVVSRVAPLATVLLLSLRSPAARPARVPGPDSSMGGLGVRR